MNKSTKKSLIFAILSVAAVFVGNIVFVILCNILTYPTPEVDPEVPGTAFGALFVAVGNALTMIFVSALDLVLTSVIVYSLSYYSNKYAKCAIEELASYGASIKLPKALRIVSIIEMIISATSAIAVCLAFIAILTFM